MNDQEMHLNIRYDAPREVWDRVMVLYQQLDGWNDYSKGGCPYWFSTNEEEKHIWASVEPGGLQFGGLMEDEEWAVWVANIKRIATKELGYRVGEIELGEVDY